MKYYSEKDVKGLLEQMDSYFIKYLEDLPSIEVPTHGNWHTGTPTEEGWYLLHLRQKDKPYCVAYMDGHHWLSINDFFILVDDVIAWQKIEPYKETE